LNGGILLWYYSLHHNKKLKEAFTEFNELNINEVVPYIKTDFNHYFLTRDVFLKLIPESLENCEKVDSLPPNKLIKICVIQNGNAYKYDYSYCD
jgi:hypothetical protein